MLYVTVGGSYYFRKLTLTICPTGQKCDLWNCCSGFRKRQSQLLITATFATTCQSNFFLDFENTRSYKKRFDLNTSKKIGSFLNPACRLTATDQ